METIKMSEKFVQKQKDNVFFDFELVSDNKVFSIPESAYIRFVLADNLKILINKQMEILDRETGRVRFTLEEKLDVGKYNCEIIATYLDENGERHLTFPTEGYQVFQINKNLESLPVGELLKETEYEILLGRIEDVETQYATKEELETAIANVDVTEQLAQGLATKADKTYVDEQIANVDVTDQLAEGLATKADKEHTHEHEGFAGNNRFSILNMGLVQWFNATLSFVNGYSFNFTPNGSGNTGFNFPESFWTVGETYCISFKFKEVTDTTLLTKMSFINNNLTLKRVVVDGVEQGTKTSFTLDTTLTEHSVSVIGTVHKNAKFYFTFNGYSEISVYDVMFTNGTSILEWTPSTTDLIGNLNADNNNLINLTPRNFTVQGTINSEVGYKLNLTVINNGITFIPKNYGFKNGDCFALSFKFKKTGGTLLSFGGYTPTFTQKMLLVNDSPFNGAFNSTNKLSDDTTEYEVKAVFEITNNASVFNIHFNRGQTAQSVTIDFWDFIIANSEIPVEWSPSSSDINTKIANLESTIADLISRIEVLEG